MKILVKKVNPRVPIYLNFCQHPDELCNSPMERYALFMFSILLVKSLVINYC